MKTVTIACKNYTESSWIVRSIQKLICDRFGKLFIAVIVHGSIATGENILYSDFDGLLIVKDIYKKSRLLKSFLKTSLKLINKFDPLQHHGWFIIYESQLKDYPQNYFPHELFEFSRSIYPNETVEIKIKIPTNSDRTDPYKKLEDSLINKINVGYRPVGMFQLKVFLSQLMLLPTLYYQAKTGRGIYKKDSFNLVEPDLSINAWHAIETCSTIRLKWEYHFMVPKWVFVKLKDTPLIRQFVRKYFAPKIPPEFASLLNYDFYAACKEMLFEMNRNLDGIQIN